MILYTAEWCGNCKGVKNFIEDNNLNVTVKDIDKDSVEVPLKALPTLEVDGALYTGEKTIIAKLKEL